MRRVSVYEEFETLLEERAPIESFTDWLHSMVDRCVVQVRRYTHGKRVDETTMCVPVIPYNAFTLDNMLRTRSLHPRMCNAADPL